MGRTLRKKAMNRGTSCSGELSINMCSSYGTRRLTSEILESMVRSETNAGMFPPGVLEVAMRHSILPFSSRVRVSALAYRPLTPFSSSLARSSSPGLARSIGMDTMILCACQQRIRRQTNVRC